MSSSTVWRLVASHIKQKAPSAVRAILNLDPSTADLTGSTYDSQGGRNDMIPTKANAALVAVLVGRMRDTFNQVERLVVDMDFSNHTVTLTAYGIDVNGDKIRTNEAHNI